MISGQVKDTLIEEITKVLIGEGVEGIKPVLELLLNTAMKVEREHFLKAGLHERREERIDYANGYTSLISNLGCSYPFLQKQRTAPKQ